MKWFWLFLFLLLFCFVFIHFPLLFSMQISYYFGIYGLLSAICVGFSMISVPFGQYAGCKARRSLHQQLLQSIVQKSIYFFQTTPFGRMMNRFSSDMAVIDKVNLLWNAAVMVFFFPLSCCLFSSLTHLFCIHFNRKSLQQVNDFFNSSCCACALF